MDRRRFFVNKNLNESFSNTKELTISENAFAELDAIYEELEEGIFDSKEKKESQYIDAITNKLRKSPVTLSTEVANQISNALINLAQDTTEAADNHGVTDNRGQYDKVATESYHFIDELISKYSKRKKESGKSASTEIIWDVIDFLSLYRARSKSANEHIKELKNIDNFIGDIVEIPKIGSDALAYTKLNINQYVIRRLSSTKNYLKKEFYIKENLELTAN